MNKLLSKKSVSTVLTVLSSIGVIATAASAVKVTPKAYEIIKRDSRINHDGDPYAFTTAEAVKSSWKCYIPTAIMGISSIACILGVNSLSSSSQATLAGAYALADRAYKKYKDYLNDRLKESISRGDFKRDPYENKTLFYDMFSNRYFESTLSDVCSAVDRVNKDLENHKRVELNDYYESIGLDGIEYGDLFGWTDDYDEVKFSYELVTLDDNLECYMVSMKTPVVMFNYESDINYIYEEARRKQLLL